MSKIICSIYFILISLTACAQFEEIETDRPGKTNTPTTIKKKWVQIEMGFLRQSQKVDPDLKDFFTQHPSLLTKYGITNRVELRLITEFATIKQGYTNGDVSYTGINSLQLGGKFNFLKQKGLRPKVSLIAHYDFRRFRTIYKGRDSIDGANFRFALQHYFSENIFLAYNIGMEWRRFGSTPAYIYTLSPRFNITEKWFAFVELYGFIWKNQAPEHTIDFGAAYYINDNFKIDASAGFGLNKKAPDNFYSIGASFRFKTSKSD
jgi:hypothetical protein